MSCLYKYPEYVYDFILENYKGRTVKELTELLNETFGKDGFEFTESKIKSYKCNHKLRSGTPLGHKPGLPTSKFPEPVFNFILENYKGTGPKQMTDILNEKFGTAYTKGQIKAFYHNRNLNSGLTGYFEKGHVPWTAGKKQKDFISPDKMKNVQASQYKKGQAPTNYLPVGTLNHTSDGYLKRKIAEPDVWKMESQIVWEKHFGKIPAEHIVIFLDGNKDNCNIENLTLVSRNEHALLNKSHLRHPDKDLTSAELGIIRLNSAITKKEKEK